MIGPEDILNALSEAHILVSMMDGPLTYMDSRGVPYTTFTHSGVKQEGEPVVPVSFEDADSVDALQQIYLEQLVAHARSHMIGDANAVLIEWRSWPEISLGRVFSRLSIVPMIVGPNGQQQIINTTIQ